MLSVKVITALAAFGVGLVSAQSTCTSDIEISEPTPQISCEVVKGDIVVKSSVSGDLVIDGPKQVMGDLTIKNNSGLNSISSSSINSIGGTFTLDFLQFLDSVDMGSVRNVNEINFVNLPRLTSLMFGSSGLTKVKSITVSDTFLDDLSQLNVATVESFTINNNQRLKTFNSDLENVTSEFIVQANGQEMQIELNSLVTAAELQISNVKSVTVPLLSNLTSSLKFDTNPDMTSFSAPNLTMTKDDISFINNIKLGNITMPKLKTISGLTILNNTAMNSITGFPALTTVNGGVILGGGFKKVELPKLNDVKGSVTVTSTADISSFCDFFDKAKSSGDIQGKETCTSKNKNANTGGDGGESSGGSSSDDDDDAAGIISVNTAILSLTAVAGLVLML